MESEDCIQLFCTENQDDHEDDLLASNQRKLSYNTISHLTIQRTMAGEVERVDPEDQECFFSGCWILTESREFIGRVFAYLPAKTLVICARVCEAWHLEADRVLRRREEIGWVTVGRVEAEQYAETPPAVQDQLGPFGVSLNTCLKTIGSIPGIAVVFSECQFPSEFKSLKCIPKETASPAKARKTAIKMIHSMLPRDCLVIGAHVDGTIGCQRDTSPAGESEGQMGSSCVLLPNIDFVRRTLLIDGTPPDPLYRGDTKCFIVFSASGQRNTTLELLRLLRHQIYTEHSFLPVIAGGIAKRLWIEPLASRCRMPMCSILSFYGPKVSAASVVLGRDITTRTDARRKILELKKAGLSEKRSLAFMFSCVGRGREYYNEADVESGVFHELFPKTPLLGFFGGGEYGCDNLTCGKVVQDLAEDDTNRADGGTRRLAQTLTSVICLLSFG